MLILTRRPGEKIIMDIDGDKVEVEVLGAQNNYDVRLGISAPKSITILREEVALREQQAKDGGGDED